MKRNPDHKDQVDEEFDRLLSRSMSEAAARQEAFQPSISRYKKCRYDLETCTIKFYGLFRSVTFPIVPIATIVPSVQEWMDVGVGERCDAGAGETTIRAY